MKRIHILAKHMFRPYLWFYFTEKRWQSTTICGFKISLATNDKKKRLEITEQQQKYYRIN